MVQGHCNTVNRRAGGAFALPAKLARIWLLVAVAPTAVLVLASCGPAQNDPGPGGVTVGEASALDEAAEMLDAQRPPEKSAQEIKPEPSGSEPDVAD